MSEEMERTPATGALAESGPDHEAVLTALSNSQIDRLNSEALRSLLSRLKSERAHPEEEPHAAFFSHDSFGSHSSSAP